MSAFSDVLLRSLGVVLLSACLAVSSRAEPEAVDDDHYRVEKLHLLVHVNADGSSVTERYEVTSLMTETGIDWYGEEKVAFSSSRESAEVLEAFTELPDGTRVGLEPKAIRLVEDDAAGQVGGYSDSRAYVVIFPRLSEGVRTHLRTRVVEHTPLFQDTFFTSWRFPLGIHYGDVVIDLSHDPAIALQVEISDVKPVVTVDKLPPGADGSTRYRFAFSNRKPIKVEEGTVGGFDVSPYVRVSSLPDMLAMGRLYQAKAALRGVVTPEVAALADRITEGIQDSLAQARALYNWVASEIRYVAIFLDDGGVVPNFTRDILFNRYGDCKDHNTLLIALLAAKGIDAESALINSGRAYRLPRLGGVSPMNHVITYLPRWDLYVDSTDRDAAFGVLHHSVADKPTVLTAQGKFGRTPTTQAAHNRVISEVSLQFDDAGRITGQSAFLFTGPSSINSRAYFVDYRGRDKADMIRDQLAAFGLVGRGEYQFAPMRNLDNPVAVTSTFELDPVSNFPGPGAMPIPVGLAPGRIVAFRTRAPLEVSALPYVCRSYAVMETYTLVYPPTVQITRLPPAHWFALGGRFYRSSYQQDGLRVTVERELVVTHPSAVCQPGDEVTYNAMLAVIQRDLRGQIFYQPALTNPQPRVGSGGRL